MSVLQNTIAPDIAAGAYPGPVWENPIESAGSGFHIVDGGTPALHIPLQSGGPGSAVIDIVAVTLDRARHVFTLKGEGALLGLDHFDHADINRTRLRLYRDPIAWLQAGGQGSAVADWMLAAPMLLGLAGIVCDDANHGDYVRNRLLRWGKCPPLFLVRRAAA